MKPDTRPLCRVMFTNGYMAVNALVAVERWQSIPATGTKTQPALMDLGAMVARLAAANKSAIAYGIEGKRDAMNYKFVIRSTANLLKLIGIWIIAAYIGIELLLLRGIDPLGANRYYDQLNTIQAQAIAHEALVYTYQPFTASFDGGITGDDWTLTYTQEGRLTPAAHSFGCDVSFIGDSVTMGHGVNDWETFANLLAGNNYGVNGYNTAQAAAIMHQQSADLYIYLMIGNDNQPPLSIESPQRSLTDSALTASRRYAYTFSKRLATTSQTAPALPAWFTDSLQSIIARDNALIFGFDNDALALQVAALYHGSIILIPRYTTTVSSADPHPDAQGHQHIAAQLAPYISQALNAFCPNSAQALRIAELLTESIN
jgi:hypothetical protein